MDIMSIKGVEDFDLEEIKKKVESRVVREYEDKLGIYKYDKDDVKIYIKTSNGGEKWTDIEDDLTIYLEEYNGKLDRFTVSNDEDTEKYKKELIFNKWREYWTKLDSYGRLLYYREIDGDGNVEERRAEYDDSGMPVLQRTTINGEFYGEIRHEYDDMGNLTRYVKLDKDRNKLEEKIRTRNKNGDLVYQKVMDEYSTEETITDYNSDGEIIKTVDKIDGRVDAITEYTYDKENSITRKYITDVPSGKKEMKEYRHGTLVYWEARNGNLSDFKYFKDLIDVDRIQPEVLLDERDEYDD